MIRNQTDLIYIEEKKCMANNDGNNDEDNENKRTRKKKRTAEFLVGKTSFPRNYNIN